MEGGNGLRTGRVCHGTSGEGMRVSWELAGVGYLGMIAIHCLPAVFHLFVALLYPLLAIELLGRLHSGLIVAFDWEHGNRDNVC